MSQLGSSFAESYSNFFKFFGDSNKSIPEINSFINLNSLKNYSLPYKINLNMIDPKNLNILFHIIRKSKSDEECLEKLKLLIEKYNIDYNVFDINQRTLPFYTCVRGYLNSTKYLLDKMDFNIDKKDIKGETLFFSAIRSYNIELVKYLDNKYEGWIFAPNVEFDSCIFNIFKKSLKDEGEKKIKNVMKFIVERGFNIDEKNNKKVSFKDLCINYHVDKYLDEVLKEKKIGKFKVVKENGDINENKNINMDNKKTSNKEANKNNINKEEDKKIKQINSNSSSKPLMNNSFNSLLIPKSDKSYKNNINKENNNHISKKREKRICCVFVYKKDISQFINNKIYEKLKTHEFFKKKYHDKMEDDIQIPSFEKGAINVIKKRIENNE